MSTNNAIVGEWIYLAQMDYDYALKSANTFHPAPVEIICFHCQQAAEKILKGYIAANGDTPVKTHDLVVLIKYCKQYSSDFDNYADYCYTLTAYISDTRYPPKLSLEESDMKQALNHARKILEFTKSKLAEMGFGTNS
ncbi:MAG: HEPN domain-containing protein [Chitinispirillales bacterium]|jgi:HEPN domain-containing protein|nr:HEPN domain-containing protein [Chitinispirillales bacterium]